ncbi:hypothetical protein ACIRPK_36220 [Kitasatospora sp. NPDC101801]|uniref:hypothetical protein n=1 Tax=Kitasatospora sp. NPDC101801 TaxID=3364103 RepID=UPI0038022CA6
MTRTFDHPQYGRTDVPAADLVLSWLNRAGVPAHPATGPSEPAEWLRWYGSAYLDPRLGAVGLAVGAAADSPHRQRQAQAAVLAWQRTLGTRRVLLPALPGRDLPAQRAFGGHSPDPASAARAFLDDGDSVLVLGAPTPALAALTAPGGQHVVYAGRTRMPEESVLRELDGDRLSFVMSPQLVAEEAAQLLHAARRRFPHLRGQHPDHWPYRNSDLVNSLRLALADADELWVLADAAPRHPLLDAALAHSDASVRDLADPTAVEEHWLTPRLRTIALVTADLCDPADRRRGELLRLLSGTGPLGVVTREVSTRITTDVHLPDHT